MRLWLKAVIGIAILLVFGMGCLSWYLERSETHEPSMLAFAETCAACHGNALQGGKLGPPLVGEGLRHGDSTEALIRSIHSGYPERGMPGFGESLTPELVKGLALYVSEQRQGFGKTSESFESRIPDPGWHTAHTRP